MNELNAPGPSGEGMASSGERPASTSLAAGKKAWWKSNARMWRPAAAHIRKPNTASAQSTRPTVAGGSRGRSAFRATTALTAATSGPEVVQERVDGRVQQHQEKRREDQEDQREEDFHRGLVRARLGRLAPARAHLVRQVAHDLADRHAERLALRHRPHK